MRTQFLECGKIVGVHGVRGELRVLPQTDSPDYLLHFSTLYLQQGEKPLPVLRARLHKDLVLMTFEGIDDRDSAMALRGQSLYLNRADDPNPETPFLVDYIGIAVTDADTGQDYGTITDILQTGANDVYTLVDSQGVERLIPAIPQVVLSCDMEQRTMTIRPLKGLFEDEN